MVRTEVADDQLRRFVVRIAAPDGTETRGTGVLVAPGWVLTCAHVVEDLDTARVLPDPAASPTTRGWTAPAAPQWVPARVRARSEPRDDSSASAFWPYPDLALLELDGWTDHPCAPLSPTEPSRSAEPHAWGFGRREQDVTSPGTAASYRYVGVDGDGYLQLAAGDAGPGLSGAPLVCSQRRGVVGLVSVSRDPNDARGGWASPVSALTGGPGVPDELARLGREVLALNREACWRHRHTWHAVLPIPEAPTLAVDQPWDGAEVDPQLAQPSVMLRPEFRVVPYRFRDTELHTFLAWCERRTTLAVSYLEAAGGAGKTRFAIEACLAAQRRGWLAGLLPSRDRGGDQTPLPRLFVVDYVEEHDAEALAERLSALTVSATELAPVRVLLLSRPVGGLRGEWALEPLKASASGQALMALEAAKDRSSAASGLAVAERYELFDAAFRDFGRTWCDQAWTMTDTATPDLSTDQHARPLDVLFEAYDAALSGPQWQPGHRPPVDRALDHEVRHWRTRMPDTDRRLLARCVALATLAGARDDAEADALFALVPDLAGTAASVLRCRLDDWLRGLYDGPDRWNPLRPDRLGEALIARILRVEADHGRALLVALLALPSDAQLQRALEVMVRLSADPAHDDPMADALAQSHTALVTRCVEQARGTEQRPGRTGLLDAVVRLHTTLLTDQRVANLPSAVQAALSLSADTLGRLARDHGRSAWAHTIFEGVFAIDERRYDLDPGNPTYRRDLSISYNKLADLARQAGDGGTARELVDRALEIRRAIHRLEPHRVDMAVEFAYVLYLSARIVAQEEPETAGQAERAEIVAVLSPFADADLLTDRGQGLLRWARDAS